MEKNDVFNEHNGDIMSSCLGLKLMQKSSFEQFKKELSQEELSHFTALVDEITSVVLNSALDPLLKINDSEKPKSKAARNVSYKSNDLASLISKIENKALNYLFKEFPINSHDLIKEFQMKTAETITIIMETQKNLPQKQMLTDNEKALFIEKQNQIQQKLLETQKLQDEIKEEGTKINNLKKLVGQIVQVVFVKLSTSPEFKAALK